MQRPIDERDLRSDNSMIVGFTYTYDRMGNKLTQGEPYDPANSETYTYDSAYRLLTFNRAAGGLTPLQSSWTLDGVGNWSGQRAVRGSTRRPTSWSPRRRRRPGQVTYDNNGNETDDGTYLYTYDALNRLIERDAQVRAASRSRSTPTTPGPADPEGRDQVGRPQRHDRLLLRRPRTSKSTTAPGR